VTTVTFAMLSDFLRNRPFVMSISTFFGLLASLCLAIWTIPNVLKWFSFFISRAAVPYGPLSMSWANEICGADAEERAVVLGIMNASGYALNAWLPLLTYPAISAPRFRKGFIFSTVAYVVQFGITGLVAFLQRRENRNRARARAAGGEVEEVDVAE
jgi:ACS family pantothenate transporter-like MFS transporter